VGFFDIISQVSVGNVIGYDSDGSLDLFIANVWSAAKDQRRTNINNQLYRNNGDATFVLIDSTTNRLLMDALTDTQKRTLLHWVGEPYHSPSWQEFWDKHAKKGQ
jgi:hypothetical protein